MSRKVKNIIMIALIIILCVCMYFTLNYRGNRGTPPTLENGDFENNMPDGVRNPNMSNSIDGENIVEESPAKPEGDGNEVSADSRMMGQGQNRPENFNAEDMPKRFERNNTIINVLIAIESVGITLIAVYLIMSKFNKLTLKETLADKNQVIIYIVLVALIAAIITIFIMYLNKNYINNHHMDNNFINSREQRQEF